MRLPAQLGPLSAALLLAALAPAGAQPLPVDETTYVERSLNHSGTLVIEHPPVAVNPYGRRNGNAAIAGFCRDGGVIRRLDAFGNPVILRQREVCDSVAPRTLSPGEVDPRPTWPAEYVVRQKVLRAKG
ncbi:hypothetical protein Q8W71_13015 [Methylobacterium sp. NEAU 140]|uniref:hypothetical protein n=1 Tax=Methylobacterium sp. NEAU 140 TaxID=3064945 RepID=UPI0027354BB4|nr:hypothetical protein [Methylobacterium sp. NEAU 140]MDP4023552.1 hypothetical protein [Methylobacterium sp. NEAU 140]